MKLSAENSGWSQSKEAAGDRAVAVLGWLDVHRWRMLTVTLPILVGIHLIFAVVTIRHSNQDSVKSDQGAEMWLAATSRDDMFPQRTDGVRHPLWSWMARHLYTEDAEAFFVRGKGLNTALCLGFLCLLGIAVTRWLDPLATINLLTLISLGILLVRGTYFQPEPLYYILSFLSGVFAWRLLRGSAFWTYPVFGGVCALAFLSKPSLLPFLLSFGSAFGLRAILSGLRREEGWPVGKNVLGLLTALAVFAVMLIPLGRFSADAFGTPFFNYTKMWMWMDDFHNEAWPFQKKFPGRVQLETLTADEIPSVTSYFQRHTFGEAWVRGWSGSNEVATRFLFPEPKLKASAVFWRESGKKWSQPLAQRGIYLCGLALLCIGLAWPVRRTLASRLAESGNLAFAVFLLVGGGLYLGLYGWYFPIGRGDRFMGGLWIPLVFLLFWWAYALRRMGDRKGGDAAYLGIHAVIFLSLLLQIVGIFWRFQHGFYLTTRN